MCIVLVLETTIGYILGARKNRNLITVILSNIITNPVVVVLALLLTVHLYQWRIWWVIALEVAAVFAEGWIYSKYKIFPKGNPYVISFVLNLLSYTTGEIINLF